MENLPQQHLDNNTIKLSEKRSTIESSMCNFWSDELDVYSHRWLKYQQTYMLKYIIEAMKIEAYFTHIHSSILQEQNITNLELAVV